MKCEGCLEILKIPSYQVSYIILEVLAFFKDHAQRFFVVIPNIFAKNTACHVFVSVFHFFVCRLHLFYDFWTVEKQKLRKDLQ